MADVQEEMRSIPQGAVCHSKRERLQTVDTHVVVMVKQRLPDKFCTILAKKKATFNQKHIWYKVGNGTGEQVESID